MNLGTSATLPGRRGRVSRRATALVSAAAALAASLAAAVTLDVPRLPAPAFADREVSGDAALPKTAAGSLRRFRLELAFDATPSNNVQAAFGRDCEPTDGKLAAEETAFIIGWDCGEWFVRPAGLRDRHTFAPADGQAACRRTLTAAIRVGTGGITKSAAFADDAGAFAFGDLALEPAPAWLDPGGWDLLRVTVRGADVAEEDVSVRFLPDGTSIIIR